MSSFGDCQFTFCSIRAQRYNPVCLAHVIMKKHILSLLNQFSLELSDGGTNHAYKPWEQVQAPPQTFCFTAFSVPFEHLLLGGVTRCLQS